MMIVFVLWGYWLTSSGYHLLTPVVFKNLEKCNEKAAELRDIKKESTTDIRCEAMRISK